jgi:pantoate--beta-alanine ligase
MSLDNAAMHIVRDAAGLRPYHACIFVPTMGALHNGHGSLIRLAREAATRGGPRIPVVVSLFVNPAQFNDPRDFQTYPRDEARDADLCAQWGADAIFAPSVETMYPDGIDDAAHVALPAVATEPGLEDAWRPGHFAGVVRVCRRLFDLVRPSVGVFGEKDWQQVQVIRAMVTGDRRHIEIVPGPTVRETDGLAMSSRNARLNGADRARAASIPRALAEAGTHTEPAAAERAGRTVLEEAGLAVEYLAVRDAQTLGPVQAGRPARVLVACRTASTRLIDNAPWPGWRWEF